MFPLLFSYVLLALAAAATLLQFFALKKEIARERIRVSIEQGRLREDLATAQLKIAEVHMEVETQVDIQYPPESGGMNYTSRARVLRLHRRGDRADQIAAILHLPQNEVALLIKLDQMTGEPAA